MGEIINLSENIKNRLEEKKEKYPHLKDFYYDEATDTLTYNGLSFSPAGYALSRTDSVFFQMGAQDVFEYLKNAFYFQSPSEMSKIRNMITTEIVITEEEQKKLKTFVRQYFKRLAIYTNNKILFDNGIEKDIDLKDFVSDLLERQKIINGVRTGIYHSVAANIIMEEYNAISNELNNNQAIQANATGQSNEFTQTNENNNELDRGMSLTRQKPSGYTFQEQEDIDRQTERNQHLGMAGFTSIILIIGAAITFGMYLALQLM